MNQFDRPSLRILGEEINAALQAVATKHGITLKYGGCSFTPTEARFRITGFIPTDGAETPEAAEFKHYATLVGLLPEHLGQTFECNGNTYRITGMTRRGGKYPILAERNGKGFKFTVRSVKIGLGLPLTGADAVGIL